MEENTELEELKAEAKDLGIKHNPNIGADKLRDKIDAYYASQETSEAEITQLVEEQEKTEESKQKPVVKGKKTTTQKAREIYEEARKTVVVTIIDNDQRVNNQTTTCKVNWSNQYHDLGTKVIPLNTPVEIPKGFLDVLKEVRIPMHTKDPKTGNARTVLRSRYTVQIEDTNPEATKKAIDAKK